MAASGWTASKQTRRHPSRNRPLRPAKVPHVAVSRFQGVDFGSAGHLSAFQGAPKRDIRSMIGEIPPESCGSWATYTLGPTPRNADRHSEQHESTPRNADSPESSATRLSSITSDTLRADVVATSTPTIARQLQRVGYPPLCVIIYRLFVMGGALSFCLS